MCGRGLGQDHYRTGRNRDHAAVPPFPSTDLLRSQRAIGAIHTVAPDRWLRAVYKAEDAASLAARLGADPIRVVQGSAEVAETASSGLALRAAASIPPGGGQQ